MKLDKSETIVEMVNKKAKIYNKMQKIADANENLVKELIDEYSKF